MQGGGRVDVKVAFLAVNKKAETVMRKSVKGGGPRLAAPLSTPGPPLPGLALPGRPPITTRRPQRGVGSGPPPPPPMPPPPAWHATLARALDRAAGAPAARYVQVATVRPDGRPTARTVVFRGWFDGDQGPRLGFVTDAR